MDEEKRHRGPEHCAHLHTAYLRHSGDLALDLCGLKFKLFLLKRRNDYVFFPIYLKQLPVESQKGERRRVGRKEEGNGRSSTSPLKLEIRLAECVCVC